MQQAMELNAGAAPPFRAGLRAAIESACERIAPVWPLSGFVAVNPFLGLSGMKFRDAAQLLEKTAHGTVLPPAAYFRDKLRAGDITADHVLAALEKCGVVSRPPDPVHWLELQLAQSEASGRLLTVADRIDRNRGTRWAGFVTDEVSKWCASYFDEGQAVWAMPWRELPLYRAWKRAAELDANPELCGLRGFRQFVSQLPESAAEAIGVVLERLAVRGAGTVDFLHRELMSVAGWSAYAAYRDWHAGNRATVEDALAIRLAYDGALLPLDPEWRLEIAQCRGGFSQAGYIAQTAAEHAFASRLGTGIIAAKPSPEKGRKALQAVFCIDVRSEVYRRALEAQSGDIETLGFAGFFGMPVQLGKSALCPVLLQPKYALDAGESGSSRAASLWKQLRTSAAACFPAVEVTGAASVVGMLREFLPKGARPKGPDFRWHIPLPEQADMVAAALRNMSLDVASLARVVLICGHGARTENNPYAASLDCGACGGHSGEVNARLAVALMNSKAVRLELKRRGIAIPDDTVFVAGLHETTTEDVILFDAAGLGGEQRKQIEAWLRQASRAARNERGVPDKEARRKAADWSEVRPEWALAGNAAFVAALRWRTKALHLGGRVFLHEYDETKDTDNSVLTLILTAPVVVASWINLQYYGSTVDNKLFGSGNKALHNVVGCFGIWEGNAGDLRTGLPLQSLHDGEKWVHEPLRLQVFVEAPRRRIDEVLRRNRDIRMLVENDWLQLYAIETDELFARDGSGEWKVQASAGRIAGQHGPSPARPSILKQEDRCLRT